MRLSDIMGGMNLAIYPIIGMGMFLSVFIGAVWGVMKRSRRAEFDSAARLPLLDDHSCPENRS